MKLPNIIADLNWTSDVAITGYIAIGVIIAVIIIILIITAIVRKSIEAKREFEAHRSLPQGSDGSDFGKMLQDKYRAERDSGEFKRPDFN